jgi:hypothetical protein
MNYNKALPLIAALLIAGGIVVYKYSARTPETAPEAGRTILIQGTLNMPMLNEIANALTPFVTAVIKEETGLDNAFMPRREQLLTLYYLEDASEGSIAEIEKNATNLITENKSACMLKNTNLAYDIRFFGDEFDALVIMANDQSQELNALYTLFKNAFNELNTSKRINYNVKKSERYGYNPHVNLGKINLSEIKAALKDSPDSNGVVERIRARIIDETLRIINEITKDQPAPIYFESVRIFDKNARTVVQEIALK